MPSLIMNKLEQLLSSLVDPVWTWVLRLPWTGRLAILLVSGVTFVASFNWQETEDFFDTVAPIAAVALHNDSGSMPLSDNYLRRASESVQRLATSLEADLSTPDNLFEQELGPWAPSQIIVALEKVPSFRPEDLIAYFNSHVEPMCHCWKEFPGTPAPRHVLVSGYVLLALAQLNAPVPLGKVRFMLNAQSGEGWWPMFLYPEPERRENASTWATAYSLLALNELLSRRLISADQIVAVNDAIRRGTSWLVRERAADQARWWDYPHSSTRKISQSLSGLAIYTMHRLGEAPFVYLDRQWLVELPESLPSADTCEISLIWTKTLDGPYQDHNCQLSLPWLLAATSDAYRNGTFMQKVRAIMWVKRVFDETNILNAETIPENWKRTEALISLRHVLNPQEQQTVSRSGAKSLSASLQ